MNQKTTYEHLITDKLEGVPIPDMADAIWARIENQLDIDMPTDDSEPDPGPDNPSGSGWIGGAGLFVFVVALITIFITSQNKKTNNSERTPVNNSISVDSNNATPVIDPILKQEDQQATTPGGPFIPKPVIKDNLNISDTTAVIPPPSYTTPLIPDTVQKLSNVSPPNLGSDTSKPKRSRGVRGITDNDYRIVPANKDSS